MSMYIPPLIEDVQRHVRGNGPWRYRLSQLYYAPEVTAAVESVAAEAQWQAAA